MSDPKLTIIQGDCRLGMRDLPAQSVQCCVTSPPYWGQRDYDTLEQLGHEPTPFEYVKNMVAVFREVHRVLCDDGTLWVNLGDTMICAKGQSGGIDPKQPARRLGLRPNDRVIPGLPRKNLAGIPWRVAMALQADGWLLRSDIIWSKPNTMPESTRDRPTKAHEYIFLLSKSERYFYDSEAVQEPTADGTRMRNRRSVWTVATTPYKGAHSATFPLKLVEPCILAGCPRGGTVLDPFGGSGTTAAVALQNGRHAILCEINSEYVPLMLARCNATL